MTFRELTKLQEKLRSAAHTSAIMHTWKRMAGTSWITARNRSQPEIDCGRRWVPSGSGSRPDMDRDSIWMDDQRWMTRGG